jgi:hypothetical protein
LQRGFRLAAKRFVRPRSGFARCVNAMIDEIDALAELATRNPTYFHDSDSTPGVSQGS